MKRRHHIGLLAAMVVAALALVVAAPASAATYPVSGDCCADGFTMTGSLEGFWGWTSGEEGWAMFFATLQYDETSGVMTFQVPETFVGTFGGMPATLYGVGSSFQKFEPGTKLYDFSRWPDDQPGTTGDPSRWLGGHGTHRIDGGTGAFEGASGHIRFRNLEPLGATVYSGVITT